MLMGSFVNARCGRPLIGQGQTDIVFIERPHQIRQNIAPGIGVCAAVECGVDICSFSLRLDSDTLLVSSLPRSLIILSIPGTK